MSFFKSSCRTITSIDRFGLVDPEEGKAYLDEGTEEANWLAVVLNPEHLEVSFYAIDHCIAFPDENGKETDICDGAIKYDRKLLFVELKKRESSGWVAKGIQQLKNTIERYKLVCNLDDHELTIAYLSNNSRPKFAYSENIKMEQFEDETGVPLIMKATIHLNSPDEWGD